MSCPKDANPEAWDALLASGISVSEATKDWLQYNTVRSPEDVWNKLLAEGHPDAIKRENELSESNYDNLSEEERAFLAERAAPTEEEMERWAQESAQNDKEALMKVFKAYNAQVTGFFPKQVDPIKLKQALAKAGFDYYQVKPYVDSAGNLGGYRVLDQFKRPVNPFRTKASYYRGDGTPITDPQEIAAKDELAQSVNALDPNLGAIPVDLDPLTTKITRANEFITKLMKILSSKHGINYQMISPAEARRITDDAENPWDGEPGFFYGGMIYFVGDNLTTNMVFHEFSHPIIRTIAKANPELFKQLYTTLSTTGEGQQIIAYVSSKYLDIDPESDLFKEEVIVRALSSRADSMRDQVDQSPEFKNWIQKVMFHVKQYIRNLFKPKIDVSKLDVNTSLDDLAKMMTNDEFKIDTELINQDDVASYIKISDDLQKDLTKIGPDVTKMVSAMKEFSDKYIKANLPAETYQQVMTKLTNEFGKHKLGDITSRLNAITGANAQELREKLGEQALLNAQGQALIQSISQLEDVTGILKTDTTGIAAKAEISKDDMLRLQYIKDLTNHWKRFLNGTNIGLGHLDDSSPLRALIDKAKRHIDDINSNYQPVITKGWKAMLSAILKPMQDAIDRRYEAEISQKEKRGASQRLLKMIRNEWESRKITPEKLESMIKGESKDANYFNAMVEGWMYSGDLVVGGFYRFLSDHITDANTRAYNNFSDFIHDIEELLDKSGLDPKDLKKFASALVFADSKGSIVDGKFQETKVMRFINQYKDWNFVVDKYHYDLHELEDKAIKSGDPTDWKNLFSLRKEFKDHQDKYFYRPYTDEFYKRDEVFKNSEFGEKAMYLRDQIFVELNQLQDEILPNNEKDWLDHSDQIDDIWNRYRNLYSLKNLDGSDKTGEDLGIAKVLNQYRDLSRSFYEWKPVPGMFQSKLQNLYEQLEAQGLKPGDAAFDQAEAKWLEKNIVYRVKPEFYTKTQDIYNKIVALYENDPNPTETERSLAKLYKERRDLLSDYRDRDGQPDGSIMPPDTLKRFLEIEKEIIPLQSKVNKGLTPDEIHDLNYFRTLIKEYGAENKGRVLSEQDQKRYDELSARAGIPDMNKYKKAELAKLFKELSEIQSKEPTEYYIDIFNDFLSKADTEELKSFNNGVNSMDKSTGDYIINLPALKKILQADDKFMEWFKANHLQKDQWDDQSNTFIPMWTRIPAWTVVRPSDPTMIETTDILGADGKTRTLQGAPSQRFMRYTVRDAFKTKKITGKTVDIYNNWLPKSLEDGAPDSTYINQDYQRMKSADPNSEDGHRFKLLETMKDHYLKMQKGADFYAQLYYDIPRLQKHGGEALTTPGYVGNRVGSAGEFLRNSWDQLTLAKNDPTSAYQYLDEAKHASIDILSDPKIPVEGIRPLPAEDVSMDIFRSMARYSMSVERQRELALINPFARSLQNVLNNSDGYSEDLSNAAKKNMINQNIFSGGKKGKGVRAAAVNAIIARDIYGQYRTGLFADNKGFNKAMNLAFKGASMSMLALNLPTALTINITQQINNFFEASAGKYFNYRTMAWGSAQSLKDMADLSFEIKKVGNHSLNVQLIEIFNAVQGRAHEKLGSSLSRTFFRDAVSLSWLYSPLKWLEAQASCQQFEAMMKFQKVTKQDGSVISYRDAWELKDGKLALIDGVDSTWGPEGEEFKKFYRTLDKVQRDLIGSFDSAGQPELQRYAIFRMYSFLRKHITNMIANRWAFTRPDPGIMDLKTGYYWKSLQAFQKTLIEGPKYLSMMTPEEVQAFRRVGAEVGFLICAALSMGLLWGWNKEDPDRFEKLRAKSGPLPMLGVADSQYPFQLDGWLANHLLLQTMKVRAWDQMWLPVPGLGLKDYLSLTTMVPIALGPTIENYGTILNDAINLAKGDPTAYYQRPVGPFIHQQEGEAKIWNHLGNIPGIKGSTVDPAMAIEAQIRKETTPTRQ